MAAVLAAVIALSSLRLSGDYFAIATFGFQMIAFSVFNNWTELTRGPLGIVGFPDLLPLDGRFRLSRSSQCSPGHLQLLPTLPSANS